MYEKMVVVLFLVLLTACSGLTIPKPASNDYFITLGGGFRVELAKGETASYYLSIVINQTKDLPDTSYAVISFKNPQDSKRPFIEEKPVAEIKNRS